MIEPELSGDVEEGARAACAESDHAAATSLVFKAYGGEIYGFLLGQFHSRSADADEVFSTFSEDFWRGLPGFQWRCSIRSWCYRLARHAASRYRRGPQLRARQQIPLSAVTQLKELAMVSRTSTQRHLRSEVKDQIRELRDRLTQDEQDLLVMRVDRGLSWREVAHAMLDSDEDDEERWRKLEVAVRKRFESVTKRLKEFARSAGLL